MTANLAEAAKALLSLLERENLLLSTLDLAAAARLVPEKQAALAAFSAALPGASPTPGEALRDLAGALAEAAAANRRLLARGIAVQSEALGIVARAVRKANAVTAPSGYRPETSPVRAAAPVALSFRA